MHFNAWDLQIIWWGGSYGRWRFFAKRGSVHDSLRDIYRWRVVVGPIELRRWAPPKPLGK